MAVTSSVHTWCYLALALRWRPAVQRPATQRPATQRPATSDPRPKDLRPKGGRSSGSEKPRGKSPRGKNQRSKNPHIESPWAAESRSSSFPESHDLATHDPKTCDTKEAGVREASSQEAKDQKAHETSQGISKHNESSRRLCLRTALGLGVKRTVWQIISKRGKHNGMFSHSGPFESVIGRFVDFPIGRLSDTGAFENAACECLRPSCALEL